MRRRRELCDAAIELIASGGIRALTHRAVDKHVGLVEGTTSGYFRTRDALLRAVFGRVADRFLCDMIAWTESTGSVPECPGTHGLANMVMLYSEGSGALLNKARVELTFHAVRDPDLDERVKAIGWEFYARAKAVIAADPAAAADPVLLEQQTLVTLTFLDGVFNGFARNMPMFADAAELNSHIQSILRGVGKP